MEAAQDYAFYLVRTGVGRTWNWFNTLSKDEWMIVLAVGCLLGMLMLRGMGKRRI